MYPSLRRIDAPRLARRHSTLLNSLWKRRRSFAAAFKCMGTNESCSRRPSQVRFVVCHARSCCAPIPGLPTSLSLGDKRRVTSTDSFIPRSLPRNHSSENPSGDQGLGPCPIRRDTAGSSQEHLKRKVFPLRSAGNLDQIRRLLRGAIPARIFSHL